MGGLGCGRLSSSSSESDESGRRETKRLGLAKREDKEEYAVEFLRGGGGIKRVTRGFDQVTVGRELRETTGKGNAETCCLSLFAREGRFAPRTSCA
jgi:hypothetical protein